MKAKRGLRLAFAGGGTGGHVVPGLHLLAELQVQAGIELEDLVWFGTGRAVEDRVLARLDDFLDGASSERVTLRLEPVGGGAPSLSGLGLRLPPAIQKARLALKRHRAELLLGLGGFTTVPAVLAARSLKIPVYLLEINAVPGRATRWLARFATQVFHAWPASMPTSGKARGKARGKVMRDLHVGPPLDPRLTRPPAEFDPGAVVRGYGLDPSRPLLLALGGSQGALGLNTFLRESAAQLVGQGANLLHQVGPGRLDEASTTQAGYSAVEYIEDIPAALRAATVVLCRGGASTLAEVGALARPAWVVPYPHHADRHQERNASMLGAGVRIIQESELDAEAARELSWLLSSQGADERERMSAALRDCVPTDAAEQIVRAF